MYIKGFQDMNGAALRILLKFVSIFIK